MHQAIYGLTPLSLTLPAEYRLAALDFSPVYRESRLANKLTSTPLKSNASMQASPSNAPVRFGARLTTIAVVSPPAHALPRPLPSLARVVSYNDPSQERLSRSVLR